MNSSRESKRLRNAKIRYFFAGMGIYIVVYLLCILLLKMVQMLVTIPPYIELVCIVLFFAAAAWFTKRIVRIKLIMNWVRP
jgi:hypothetical protein